MRSNAQSKPSMEKKMKLVKKKKEKGEGGGYHGKRSFKGGDRNKKKGAKLKKKSKPLKTASPASESPSTSGDSKKENVAVTNGLLSSEMSKNDVPPTMTNGIINRGRKRRNESGPFADNSGERGEKHLLLLVSMSSFIMKIDQRKRKRVSFANQIVNSPTRSNSSTPLKSILKPKKLKKSSKLAKETRKRSVSGEEEGSEQPSAAVTDDSGSQDAFKGGKLRARIKVPVTKKIKVQMRSRFSSYWFLVHFSQML